jgi:antitoxin component YwqK of YwqJK toxin-antitoxin module
MKTKKITKTGWWGGKEEYEVNELGQKHGKYKDWYSNGNKCLECTYKNGKLHGLFKDWFLSGKIDYINTQKKDRYFGTMIQFK